MNKIEGRSDCLYLGENKEYYVSVSHGEIDFLDSDEVKLVRYPIVIEVAQTANHAVLVRFFCKEKQCIDFRNYTHVNNGIFYFVLSESEHKKAKYVYSFDSKDKSIHSILGPLQNPHFIRDRLIEFGSGFIQPGSQESSILFKTGEGIITVYDLTQRAGQKMMQKFFVKKGGGFGWDGEIDKKANQIIAFDHVLGTRIEFPIPS